MRRLTVASMVLAAAVVSSVLAAPVHAAGPAQARKTVPTTNDLSQAQAAADRAGRQVRALSTQLSAADARLQALGTALEQSAEAYNGALVTLAAARTKADAARKASAQAQAELGAAQGQLASFASAAYRSGGDLANFDAMLGADGPQTMIDQASTLRVVGEHQSTAVDRVAAARLAADVLRQQADSAFSQVQKMADLVRQAKVRAERDFAAQQLETKRLSSQQSSLTARLDLLTARSVSLQRQRAEALAAAAGSGSGGAGGISVGAGLGLPVAVPVGVQRGTADGAKRALAYARAQLGKPYQWAATGPKTFDCSGLTLMAWRSGGVDLVHFAATQYAEGKKIPLGQARAGDLVFFATDLSDWRTIHHVGMYIGGGQMIEAPYTGANVRVSSVYRASLFGVSRP